VPVESLGQIIVILLFSVLVVALARRIRLPPILGYLIVGVVLGPSALGLLANTAQAQAIGQIGVVFLLFTIGLEFSLPRMIAMRREVFALGSAQTLLLGATGAVLSHAAAVPWGPALVVGGALAMSSTAIVLQQLGTQDELNRTHGRLSFAVLLFQDLAFVPLLALATVQLQGGRISEMTLLLRFVALGLAALIAVLAIGRWLLRPLLYEIAHSRLRELFTLTVLLVVSTASWMTDRLGLSMALGAFLAGMMFAETEYRHQIEAVIRPFRELLLGLFFIAVGLLLDVRLLFADTLNILGLLLALVLLKALLSTLTVRVFGTERFKALRTGIVLSGGGELGIALLTVLARAPHLIAPRVSQPLLAALVLSMIVSPVIIRYNKRIARLVLGERGPPAVASPGAAGPERELATREHVLLCGFGRVGHQLARVLGAQGFEYLAVELDPAQVRAARQAGEPVVWGDSADEDMLRTLGLDHTTVVVVTFADPTVAISVVRAVRRLRRDVPVLVRTPDDATLAELSDAGATEVVPETFEASLTLVSQALALLGLPVEQVLQVAESERRARYGTLRSLAAERRRAHEEDAEERLRSVVLPPGAWAVGRQLAEIRARGAEVAFTAIRRHGITGREPAGDTELREGDVVVIYGMPEALEHAESVLLVG
jgi:monovalent cation:H+ antiporter-2, CPA2 family